MNVDRWTGHLMIGLGFTLMIGGVAMLSIPIACIVAGLLLFVAGGRLLVRTI